VNYAQPNPAQNDISQWLIQNPQRVNLARIGFEFGGEAIAEDQLTNKSQELDLWTGRILSNFVYDGKPVQVETYVHPDSDVIGIQVKSDHLATKKLGIFLDFPYPTRNKFDAPYVGVYNDTTHHNVSGYLAGFYGSLEHSMDGRSYFIGANWDTPASIVGQGAGKGRYTMTFSGTEVRLAFAFAPGGEISGSTFQDVVDSSERSWREFWDSGAFIDFTGVDSNNATELQRRSILSQYLTMVNSASSNPPQESGLVNNGWYGKFHMEMCFWHTIPFARWNRFPLYSRSMPGTYQHFLVSSIDRASAQGYKGARWPKMTDPTGRSAPGEINSLLIWQQPHPMYFAETEYRAYPTNQTLEAWDGILSATADFMVSYAFFNATTGVYDLGPPMYPVSENTNPNATINPTFELAYWRFGLDVAIRWKGRLNQGVPTEWITVRDNLAPLPVVNGTYPVYEGIPNMWTDNKTTFDHPAMAGVYGWLPPPASGPSLNMTVVRNTAAKIKERWALEESYGWDFAVLAMNALRLGDVNGALEYLLHPKFEFDDAGYPLGGNRVATPYFPNSAGLLVALAMMAGGWDGSEGAHFPKEWDVKVEGFAPVL
jgi:hypothetical protein